MNFFLPDTNVIKSKDFSFEELYKPLNFSAVVITELMTACDSNEDSKFLFPCYRFPIT